MFWSRHVRLSSIPIDYLTVHVHLQSEETASTDIVTTEFVSATFFQSERDVSEPLVHGYVSSDRVAELITKYIKDILTPLLPNLNYAPGERSSSP